MLICFYYLEWEKWNVKPSHKPGDETTELEESTAIIGDAGVRGSYLEENEGMYLCITGHLCIVINCKPK